MRGKQTPAVHPSIRHLTFNLLCATQHTTPSMLASARLDLPPDRDRCGCLATKGSLRRRGPPHGLTAGRCADKVQMRRRRMRAIGSRCHAIIHGRAWETLEAWPLFPRTWLDPVSRFGTFLRTYQIPDGGGDEGLDQHWRATYAYPFPFPAFVR